jgi:hypothetical protein
MTVGANASLSLKSRNVRKQFVIPLFYLWGQGIGDQIEQVVVGQSCWVRNQS